MPSQAPLHAPSTTSTADADLPILEAIQQDFPQFVVWREAALDRVRYVARARDLTTSLHTVVTADLGELRAALAETAAASSLPLGNPPSR